MGLDFKSELYYEYKDHVRFENSKKAFLLEYMFML